MSLPQLVGCGPELSLSYCALPGGGVQQLCNHGPCGTKTIVLRSGDHLGQNLWYRAWPFIKQELQSQGKEEV